MSAGFPSPAEDRFDAPLDLNRALVHYSALTFYVREAGDSMIGDGIDDGDRWSWINPSNPTTAASRCAT